LPAEGCRARAAEHRMALAVQVPLPCSQARTAVLARRRSPAASTEAPRWPMQPAAEPVAAVSSRPAPLVRAETVGTVTASAEAASWQAAARAARPAARTVETVSTNRPPLAVVAAVVVACRTLAETAGQVEKAALSVEAAAVAAHPETPPYPEWAALVVMARSGSSLIADERRDARRSMASLSLKINKTRSAKVRRFA